MRPLYLAWLEFSIWLIAMVLWVLDLENLSLWWQPFVIWLVIMALFLLTKRLGFSPWVLILAGFLVLLGWLFLCRLDPSWAQRQFLGFLIAALAYLLGLFFPLIQLFQPRLLAGLSLALLFVTALFGTAIGGAKAWLNLGLLSFQPVEISRILLVAYFGIKIAQDEFSLTPYLVLGSFFLLSAWQKDLGPALLVFLVCSGLLLSTRFSWRALVICLSLLPSAFAVAYFAFPHFQNRVFAWLKPWDYPDGRGYQILQGLFALKAGGIFGQGVKAGLVNVIPAVHTDYLLAVIGEELGLLGTSALILVYLALAFFAIYSIEDVAGAEKRNLGLGLILLLHGQVFLVIGGMLRFLPFTGLTLPFVSFGSTSLVAQFWMLGMLAGLGGSRGES